MKEWKRVDKRKIERKMKKYYQGKNDKVWIKNMKDETNENV